MTTLELYLGTIRRLLPRRKREDILWVPCADRFG